MIVCADVSEATVAKIDSLIGAEITRSALKRQFNTIAEAEAWEASQDEPLSSGGYRSRSAVIKAALEKFFTDKK